MSVGKVLTSNHLKGLLTDGLVFRGAASGSLNDITVTGYYTTSPSNQVADLPDGSYQYGFLIHLKAPDRTLQVYVSIGNGNPVYLRSYANNAWRPWNQLSNSVGVKRCTSSAREQKGGCRHESSEGTDEPASERITHGCVGVQRERTLRPERLQAMGTLPHSVQRSEFAPWPNARVGYGSDAKAGRQNHTTHCNAKCNLLAFLHCWCVGEVVLRQRHKINLTYGKEVAA